MKKLLMLIAFFQEELINGFSAKRVGSLKKVSGKDLPGDLSTLFYEKIVRRINLFKPDWSRFKTDSGKIVIQKDLFLRLLKLFGLIEHFAGRVFDHKNFFMFRNIDHNGMTHATLDRGFKYVLEVFENKKNKDRFVAGVIWLFGLVASIITAVYYQEVKHIPTGGEVLTIWWVYLGVIIGSIISVIKVYIISPRAIDRIQAWLCSRQNDPIEIMRKKLSTSSPGSGTYVKVNFNFGIELHKELEKKCNAWIDGVLREMVNLKEKLNGQGKSSSIVWLWDYQINRNNSNYDFNPVKKESNFGGYYEITIRNLLSGRLLPALETKTAFIFWLPPDDLHQYSLDDLNETTVEDFLKDTFEEFKERLFLSLEEESEGRE